tara:strand:- start:5631 stop:6536 length:906 start_codon:yes stop_codon:yes gene_type:complete
MTDTRIVPKVSIGMPVFNGEKFIRGALDSLLGQSFTDFELIISDNGSTDGSELICREYAARDQRIRYVRQETNLGAGFNFKFVLDEARSEYFMWAACDDTRSLDFIEVNHKFLFEYPEFVASTSPSGFSNRSLDQQKLINFSLEGSLFERFINFFKHCWVSHGIFYSLVRTDVLRGCDAIGQSYTAVDWSIILYLASKGKVNRSAEGHAIFGVQGVSSSSNSYKAFRNDTIELILPFYRLAKYVLGLTKGFTLRHKLQIIRILISLNIRADYERTYGWLYSIYCKYFRHLVRKNSYKNHKL